MRLAGWKRRQMLTRYGAPAADERLATPTSGSARAIGCSVSRGVAATVHDYGRVVHSVTTRCSGMGGKPTTTYGVLP